MMRAPFSRLAFAGLLLVTGCTTSTEESTFDNPFDPKNAGSYPIPDSITVLVGNNAVRLGWSLEAGSDADLFAVFRRRIDLPTPEAREEAFKRLYRKHLLALRCGTHSIRLRPALDVRPEAIDRAAGILAEVAREMGRS